MAKDRSVPESTEKRGPVHSRRRSRSRSFGPPARKSSRERGRSPRAAVKELFPNRQPPSQPRSPPRPSRGSQLVRSRSPRGKRPDDRHRREQTRGSHRRGGGSPRPRRSRSADPIERRRRSVSPPRHKKSQRSPGRTLERGSGRVEERRRREIEVTSNSESRRPLSPPRNRDKDSRKPERRPSLFGTPSRASSSRRGRSRSRSPKISRSTNLRQSPSDRDPKTRRKRRTSPPSPRRTHTAERELDREPGRSQAIPSAPGHRSKRRGSAASPPRAPLSKSTKAAPPRPRDAPAPSLHSSKDRLFSPARAQSDKYEKHHHHRSRSPFYRRSSRKPHSEGRILGHARRSSRDLFDSDAEKPLAVSDGPERVGGRAGKFTGQQPPCTRKSSLSGERGPETKSSKPKSRGPHARSPSPRPRRGRSRSPKRSEHSKKVRSRPRSRGARTSKSPRSPPGSRRGQDLSPTSEMYNNHFPSRGRPSYPGQYRQYPNSPPHQGQVPPSHHAQHGYHGYGPAGRGGWQGPHQGSPQMQGPYSNHGSPYSQGGYSQPPSPYYANPSYGPGYNGPQHGGYGQGPYRGRGGMSHHSPPPQPNRTTVFSNLSWTPSKGSRGGIAPTERLPPPSQPASSETGTVAEDDFFRPQAQFRVQEESVDEHAPKKPKKDDTKTQLPVEAPLISSSKAPTSELPTTPAKATGIKFDLKKAATPQPLSTRPNVMQAAAAAKPPPRAPPSRQDYPPDRRSDFAPRGRPGPPGPHYSSRGKPEYGPPSRYPPRDIRDSRFSHEMDRGFRDSKPYRNFDSRSSSGNMRQAPRALEPLKPKRKRIVKIIRKHKRVVLPPKKLPKVWAESSFVYYPKPDRESVVGAGTYGKVFKAHNVYRNSVVALKTLPLIKPKRKPGSRKRKRQDRYVKDGLHLTSLREIKLLKSISHLHDNVVGIREIFLEGQSCNLVFDYYEFDMHGIIYSSKINLPEAMMKDLMQQLFMGLDFLHTKAHILHRDIKAANILVSSKGQVKITDFGLAKQYRASVDWDTVPLHQKRWEHSNRVITTPYRPPELLLGATCYGPEVDVWSAGCVILEAYLKKLPFQGTGEDVDHLLTLWKILGTPTRKSYPEASELEWYWLFRPRTKSKKSIFSRLFQRHVPPQLFHLLRCIFQHNPVKRPTAEQCLAHGYFTAEAPLPQCAAPVLQKVEGEWHELEYKMIRDKEKAEQKRKLEDRVVLGYLQVKIGEHERKADDMDVPRSEVSESKAKVRFYKARREEYIRLLKNRPKEDGAGISEAQSVAEMKKTHGELYMDATRRGRYREARAKEVDEKLVTEAWRWWEDEKGKKRELKLGEPSRRVGAYTAAQEAKSAGDVSAGKAGREERKRAFEKRMAEFEKRKARREAKTTKRRAESPLEGEAKRSKETPA